MFFSKKLSKFKEIHHCFFSRKGGFSKGLYKGLNCGRGSKDKKKNIKKNLHYVAKKIGVKIYNLILMHQTHSNRVIEIKKSNLRKNINSDAMISCLKGVALGVVTADCVPILIFDNKNKIIGCVHAGWRGALAGIISKTISKIRKISKSKEIYASVGPCIGQKSYEVSNEFYKIFLLKSDKNKKYFLNKNMNKKFFNLRKFVLDELLNQKVVVDNINRDTFKEKENFFSYRRSSKLKQNDYGRCISVITLV